MFGDPASQEEKTPIKVIIASDRPLFREALAEVLSKHEIETLGEVGEEPQVLDLARERKPNVVIVDLESGATGLPQAIHEVHEASPHTEVVVVTRFDSPVQARALLKDGAHAYLGRSATTEELLMALHSVEDPTRKTSTVTVVSKQASRITDRELEILLLAARGLSNQHMANELYLSVATIKRHLANIYEKLGVSSRSEATVKALAAGWISPADILSGNYQEISRKLPKASINE